MRKLGLLIALLAWPLGAASAQEIDAAEGTVIRSAEVSGLSTERLSPTLRQDVAALVGDPLNREHLLQLAARIEGEHPDFVVAIRGIAAPENEVRIIFLAARISDDRDLEANINARYTVESVNVEGIPESQIPQGLRDELQALVGKRLDHDEADRLARRMTAELPGYEVQRRMSRGSERGRIRLVLDVTKSESLRWLHFEPSKSKMLYHSDQGWSGFLNIQIGSRDYRVTPLFALDDGDDLIEEYSGLGVRLESRKVASERLGISLELTRFEQTWRRETLAVLDGDPGIPEAYRTRSTVAPMVLFALNPHVRVNAGVSITELESLTRPPAAQMANAAIAGIGYDQRWESSASSHALEASFTWRSGIDALESDLVYTRSAGSIDYEYRRGDSNVLAGASIGGLTGAAPIFERFSLGNSSTLRGWNKYDIAPAGGDRMFHSSIEFRHHGLAFFLDAGSVWDEDSDMRVRFASGIGYHRSNVFLTLGLPLNTDDLQAVFTAGVRF